MTSTSPKIEQLQRLAARLAPEAGQVPEMDGLDPSEFDPGELRLAALALKAGRPPSEVLGDLSSEARMAIFAANPDGAAPLLLKTLSATDILTTEWPEPVWAIPGILPVGLTVLAGKPKVGKSWLALQIAQAVALGGVALGQKVEAGPVLYLALEDSPRRLKDRMQCQGWPSQSAGDCEFMCWLDFESQVGTLNDPLNVEKLAAQMHAKRYRYVVIDTLSRAVRGDQNDADAMTRALSPLQATALDLNAALILIDHHRKASTGETDPILDLGGSVAKAGVADCLWGLYKEQGKAGAILHIVGRDVEERRLQLAFDPVTRCWQNEGDADKAKITEARREVLDALQTIGLATLTDIVRETGGDKGNTYKLLQNMVNEGLLTRQTRGHEVLYSVKL